MVLGKTKPNAPRAATEPGWHTPGCHMAEYMEAQSQPGGSAHHASARGGSWTDCEACSRAHCASTAASAMTTWRCAQAVPNSNQIAGEVPEPGLTLPSVNSAIGEERAPSCRNPLSPAVADSQQKGAFRT